MTALTISLAAKAWGVHRDTVKSWIKAGKVDATKDNGGVWRIADGQQPPPGADLRRPHGVIVGLSQDDPSDDPRVEDEEPFRRLAEAETALAVARRELELLRERLDDERDRRREQVAELKADRDRLASLLTAALARPPTLLDRLARALRRP